MTWRMRAGRLTRWALAALAIGLGLGGCGGGDGADANGSTAGTTQDEESLAPGDRFQIAATGVTVSGKVTFVSVPNTNAGPLNYDASAKKPVRGVLVEARESGTNTLLARGSTGSTGKYSLTVPENKRIVIRVQARMLKSAGTGRWDVAVRDNTNGNRLYTMQTAAFNVGTSAVTRNVNATSGWNGSTYGSTRVAGPFAILDTVYSAIRKVRSAQADARFPKLAMYWSPNNRPSSGNTDDGEIGTSFFRSDQVAIYLLGAKDTDTDEYDSTVVAHEWGHYYQYAFSRDDSMGGPHGEGDKLDRTVAFSEGWGNAWSGIALGRSVYADSYGAAQSNGFSFSLATSPDSDRGWFNESSVQYILWKLNQSVGFTPINAALQGKLKTSPAVTSIHSFAASLGSAASSATSALKPLLRSQSISTSTSDPYGAGETNDGGVAAALPLYRVGTMTSPPARSQVCTSNTGGDMQAGDQNKLGATVYVRLRSVTAGSHDFSVSGPAGSDPDVTVWQRRELKASAGEGSSETFTVSNMTAGDAVLAINDYQLSGAKVCFAVQVD